MQFDLDVLPLANLCCKLGIVLTLVDEVKHESAVDSCTDESVVLVLLVQIVEVDEVDQSDGLDVDRLDQFAVLVQEDHLEISSHDQVQLSALEIYNLTRYLCEKPTAEIAQCVLVSSIVLSDSTFLPVAIDQMWKVLAVQVT